MFGVGRVIYRDVFCADAVSETRKLVWFGDLQQRVQLQTAGWCIEVKPVHNGMVREGGAPYPRTKGTKHYLEQHEARSTEAMPQSTCDSGSASIVSCSRSALGVL